MLTMLEIPKPDPPQAAPPLGISPEKLAAVKDSRAGVGGRNASQGSVPQKLTILLENFGPRKGRCANAGASWTR